MSESSPSHPLTLNDLFPQNSRLLLTGGGKEFLERIGVEAARRVVLGVMMGENVRTQTEPLTRRRIAQASGAMAALFAQGCLHFEDFTSRLSAMAVEQIKTANRNDNASIWPAQWLLGLTGKSVQNVLRNNPDVQDYLTDFETAVREAAVQCQTEIGDLQLTLGFVESPDGRRAKLDWEGITRLTTAIGSLTLTLRGSDKSIYGKLFERLVLGSVLAVLGFRRVDPRTNTRTHKVFWLADSSNERESDATLLLQPGKLARFDIGFIGPGNPEISKDKLSRYAREIELAGGAHHSTTFIIIDRLPKTGKTEEAAKRIGAEIIQMSMRYWPRDLAQRLGHQLGFKHELQTMPDAQIEGFLESALADIRIQDFLIGVSPEDLSVDAELPEAEEEIEGTDV
ncbi:MAG TPA: CfrBI family restriction endonuclease [Chthonomonadaceae bacterium]|nr:CfrBI family restriction endonuclease [Chthonomonadaceae bacterium]